MASHFHKSNSTPTVTEVSIDALELTSKLDLKEKDGDKHMLGKLECKYIIQIDAGFRRANDLVVFCVRN